MHWYNTDCYFVDFKSRKQSRKELVVVGIFYKNEKRDLQYNEDDLQMMVQTLPGFQGTK